MKQEAKYKVGDKLWFTDEDGRERYEEVRSVSHSTDDGSAEYRMDSANAWGFFHFRKESQLSPFSLRERVERLERILGQLAEIGKGE